MDTALAQTVDKTVRDVMSANRFVYKEKARAFGHALLVLDLD